MHSQFGTENLPSQMHSVALVEDVVQIAAAFDLSVNVGH